MTKYHGANVKLQIHNLINWNQQQQKTGVNLRLSPNITGNTTDETNFPCKI